MSRSDQAARAPHPGRLHLVRHGRPMIDPAVRSTQWPLDPAHLHEVRALRPALPTAALWFSSPEPKARQTAALLTDGPVTVVDDLREQGRSGWFDDLATVVDRAFTRPDVPAADGWERLDDCRRRVVAAVDDLRSARPGGDLVLVGHGTAWTVLLAEIDGAAPETSVLRALSFPDVVTR